MGEASGGGWAAPVKVIPMKARLELVRTLDGGGRLGTGVPSGVPSSTRSPSSFAKYSNVCGVDGVTGTKSSGMSRRRTDLSDDRTRVISERPGEANGWTQLEVFFRLVLGEGSSTPVIVSCDQRPSRELVHESAGERSSKPWESSLEHTEVASSAETFSALESEEAALLLLLLLAWWR